MTSFTTRDVPWMKLGTVIEHDVNIAEAARLGGLDFDVELRPVAYADSNGKWRGDPNRHAVVATDTDHVFDYVSNDYSPIQYATAFEFMDEVGPRVVAAGTLRNRAQGFIVVQSPERPTLNLDLKGEADPHDMYAVLRTSHDRSRGLEVAYMALRGRCMNQLTLSSFMADVPQRWAVRHVGDVTAKLAEAKLVMTRLDNYADAYAETARRLVETDVLVDEVRELLEVALPNRPKQHEQVNAIVEAWRSSPHVGFTGTAWGVVQAVSEYFEWGRESASRTPQSRFIGGLDGPTHKMVGRTAQLLLRRA